MRYFDSWFRGTELCILMEYCSNGNLENYLSGVKSSGECLPEMEVAYKMSQLLSALDHCHNTLCVIHRDIKPANILLDFMGRLKLADFGISKQVRDLHMMAATQAGTPIYMPPEMISGYSYTFKADVWMLGCVIYEIMALDTPWGRDIKSWAELAQKVCHQPINTSMLRRNYSSDLTRTVFWMLERDASKRPTTSELLGLCHIQAPAAPQVDLYQTITPARGLRSAPAAQYGNGGFAAPNYPPQSSYVSEEEVEAHDGGYYQPHGDYVPPPPSPTKPQLFNKPAAPKRIVPRRASALPPTPPRPVNHAERDVAAEQIQLAMRQSLTRRRPRLPPLAPTPARAAARPGTPVSMPDRRVNQQLATPRGSRLPSPVQRQPSAGGGYARPRPGQTRKPAWVG